MPGRVRGARPGPAVFSTATCWPSRVSVRIRRRRWCRATRCGVVDAVGDGCDGARKAGDRVGMGFLGGQCNACEFLPPPWRFRQLHHDARHHRGSWAGPPRRGWSWVPDQASAVMPTLLSHHVQRAAVHALSPSRSAAWAIAARRRLQLRRRLRAQKRSWRKLFRGILTTSTAPPRRLWFRRPRRRIARRRESRGQRA